MSDFSIKIGTSSVSISLNENLPETDILEMLRFDESGVEDLLMTHSSNQSYWEALAIRLRVRFEEYKEGWVKKWWSYHRLYAKNVLAAYGDPKPTVDAIQDMTILVYSSETSEEERKKYASLAYKVAQAKAFHGSQEEYEALMYKYLRLDPPWFFETLVHNQKRLQEESETIQAVADRLHAQAFHLDMYAKMQIARKGNVESGGINEKQLLDGIRGKGK